VICHGDGESLLLTNKAEATYNVSATSLATWLAQDAPECIILDSCLSHGRLSDACMREANGNSACVCWHTSADDEVLSG